MNRLIEELSAKKQEMNISYRELGRQIGMSVTHVSQVLQGKHPLTRNFALQVGLSNVLPSVDVTKALEMAGLLPGAVSHE